VTITRDDFYGNAENAEEFENHREFNKVGKRWTAASGNDPAHGERLLQSADERHQLSRRRSAAAALRRQIGRRSNYGNTGSTIGHELTHGFDDEGRQFDLRAI